MDFQVKQDFKYKRFSRLEYLSQSDSWNEDESNLGLYYFLLESKGKTTDTAFNEILAIKGELASAYNYLGDVAFKLFEERTDRDIPTYYYEQALKFSETNSHSYWGLYHSTHDPRHFFQSIVIDYKLEEFKKITNKMFSVYPTDLVEAEFSQNDWKLLKSICLDERIEHQNDVLLICYFHLGEFDNGVNFLMSEDYVSREVVKLYQNHGNIDEETFLSKISYYERIKLVGTAELAYEEIKKEAKKGQANPTQEVIIKYAFEANAYNDVIDLVEGKFKKDKVHFSPNVLKLYHLISSLYLGLPLKDDFEKDVNSNNYFGDIRSEDEKLSLSLYLVYLILKNINKLESLLVKRDDLHELTHYALYKDIKANLSHECLIGHYLYNSLVDNLQRLKERWHRRQVEYKLKSAKDDQLAPEVMAGLLMDKGEYSEALNILSGLKPTMSVNNMLGVCFEHIGDWNSALEHSKLALEAMLSSGEKNNTIINNYLYCLHKSGNSIDKEQYESYVELFNQSLTEGFLPHVFLHDNGNSLFKYYPFNNFTLDALVNGYFYLASAEQLNDPLELPYEDLTKDKEFVVLRPNFRLSSFSHNENSMLMWSHYAENHTGLMIEYCFEGNLPEGVGIEKVQYLHPEERFMEKDKYLFNQYMLIKNKDWNYEKEVRLFGYKRDKVYYEKLPYPKRSSHAAAYVKSITVGYRFSESTIKLVQNIVSTLNESRNKNLPKIILRRAKLSNNNFFDLEYEEIGLDSRNNIGL
ncbi:DUF2971 domain-containing protein [Vibrio cholerae]|uniref:DUF2971 domain-containing protein n=1 Tax=Vibrio cholerae TaxID=666 RepID=UPI0010FDEC61|nr:DUF2971 domain-containing protein [Vibrio cholerae]EKF9300555.1 DUF2971 domain-containing protein [Vibrio cholerae]MCD1208284.1 hypothetical protein [Vibrio cholerae]TLE25954.1 DUF2971 domain-containing protein [Vibrio cholerae]TLE31099.1 DUF2971 domain-containing protein [Vibrio cholerae]TLE35847.1 DUF2971 domain-containing protein [Vibrio cholerae]